MKRLIRLVMVAALSIGWQLDAVPAAHAHEEDAPDPSASACHLGNDVSHVVSIVFDNVHFTRDNPNVPSDLEQMPSLLNFLKRNGALLTNEHTPLIAHTATDILTTLTGLYGDGMGVPVSNSYRYFNPNNTTNPATSFAYWTSPVFDYSLKDPTTSTDKSFNLITPKGTNTPAPWVPFTRVGCNVGGVSTANIELENIGIDIPTVFGAGSPQAIEAQNKPDQATADFVGIAVHCAKNNALCSAAKGGRADKLPQEPGGYNGYNALFGHAYVGPAVGGIKAIDGTPINGFPGFDGMPANNTLGYIAAMQEHGVPVTYGYISDAHAPHPDGNPFWPGQVEYTKQLKDYDTAFAKFFDRLAKHGITPKNTVFIVSADENDHLIAGKPSPANCNGVTIPCTYDPFGEVSANLKGLVASQTGVKTAFTVHSDSAPNVYITGNPAQTDSVTRDLERAVGAVKAINPYTGVNEVVDNFLADQAQQKLMHMMSTDQARNPTFTMFAKPDYFLFAGAPTCSDPKNPCISINPMFDWNHGDISPDINVTWVGFAGPGVKHLGVTHRFWTDHSDIRPTLMALTDLKDDYAHQGRPITEIMEEGEGLSRLAAVYKQINAPVGQLSLDSVKFATKAINSTSAGDQTYVNADAKISSWTARRDALVAQMIVLLDPTAPGSGEHDDDNLSTLIKQGRALLAEVHQAAA